MSEQDVEMSKINNSIDTLVSISGTLAGIGLALVGILSAKNSITKVESIADDLFLFSSFGFLLVLSMGYLAQKVRSDKKTANTLAVAEWIFAASLILILGAGVVLVYTEI